MKRNAGIKFIVAVVFATALLLGGSAEASNLFGLGGDSSPRAERQLGLFEQAFNWLTSAWTDMTSVFDSSQTTPPPSTTTGNCDAGIGLDPEGCPRQ
ncbi:MAG TPA: hypothetical protein VN493_26450 [Thermoanaerobaculia bacterium]|nr:hypothetical protein [Thermoanaerobaculia bacterium]